MLPSKKKKRQIKFKHCVLNPQSYWKWVCKLYTTVLKTFSSQATQSITQFFSFHNPRRTEHSISKLWRYKTPTILHIKNGCFHQRIRSSSNNLTLGLRVSIWFELGEEKDINGAYIYHLKLHKYRKFRGMLVTILDLTLYNNKYLTYFLLLLMNLSQEKPRNLVSFALIHSHSIPQTWGKVFQSNPKVINFIIVVEIL